MNSYQRVCLFVPCKLFMRPIRRTKRTPDQYSTLLAANLICHPFHNNIGLGGQTILPHSSTVKNNGCNQINCPFIVKCEVFRCGMFFLRHSFHQFPSTLRMNVPISAAALQRDFCAHQMSEAKVMHHCTHSSASGKVTYSE